MLVDASPLLCEVSFCKGLFLDVPKYPLSLPSQKNHLQLLLHIHLTFDNEDLSHPIE